jgi:alpha-tubulin suppressor-like RCC1 family protein
VRILRESRRLVQVATSAALAIGLAGGALATSGAAQARPSHFLPSRSLAVSCGLNQVGQLGNGSTALSTTYGGVSGLTGVTQVSAGSDHGLALTTDGTVWAWGSDAEGQLGNGSVSVPPVTVPVPVAGLTGVTQIAAGHYFSLALTSDGSVWAWGDNSYDELGNGTSGSMGDTDVPVQVPGLTGVSQIAAGNEFSLARRSDGTVWAWGDNTWGQLGNDTTSYGDVPIQVPGLTRVTQIAAGQDWAMAARTQGFITTATSVWTWGRNDNGQLGDGTLTTRSTPEAVGGISVPGIREIAAGGDFALVLGSDGSVWGWGGDFDSQLGNSPTFAWTAPVETIGMDSGITQLSAGASHALALRSDGTVLAWGNNQAGEIGTGAYSDPTLPVVVPGLTNVTQVSAGAEYSLAVHTVYGRPLLSSPPSLPSPSSPAGQRPV